MTLRSGLQRSGLKRLGFGVVALVVAAVAAVAAAPLLVRADAVREALAAEIRFVTGLDPVLRGNVAVSLFPSGAVTFSDVVLLADGTGGPAMSAETVTTQLRVLPLLLGRVEIANVALQRPTILVNLDAEGRSNWSELLTTLTRTLKPVRQRDDRVMSFSEIAVRDGVVRVRDAANGIDETLTEVALSLGWPAIAKGFGATGQFVWRGQRVDASVSLGDFFSALMGERSGLKLRLASPLLKVAFDGQVSHRPALKVDGTLATDSPSLRAALAWAGQKPLPGGGLGRFSMKAHTNIIGRTVAFTGVNVELDGNAAEGVLTVIADGRPVLQGTLAAEQLDVTPYISAVKLMATSSERSWDQTPLALEGLNELEMDLRLSAARVQLGPTKVGRTAASASLRNGHFVVAIGEAQAFGGTVKGSIGIANANPGADVKAQLQFADVDLESAIGTVFGVRRLEGRGHLGLTMEGTGPDVLALTRTINGSATLTATKGAITGIDVEQLLRRLERRPLSGGGEFRTGRTPFDRLAVKVNVVDGQASVEDVQLEGTGVRLAVGGQASIPSRDLDLKGTASLTPVAKAAPAAPFELPFVVRGQWEDPVMLPDVQSLIRRSGAAAPLLDAVRGGRGRDAVRSAIEQLTRGGETPAAAPSAAALPPAAATVPADTPPPLPSVTQ